MRKIAITLALLLITLTATCPTLKETPFQIETRLLEFRASRGEITEKLLWLAIRHENIAGDSIVYAQAIHETGRFTSDLFHYGDNLFGMKPAKQRKTLATGEIKSYAKYDDWLTSIRDYKLFQEYYKSMGYDLSNYRKFLKDIGYAKDPEYINRIDKIIRQELWIKKQSLNSSPSQN